LGNDPTTILAGLFLYTLCYRLILMKYIANFILHLTEEALNFTRQNADSN